MPTQPWLLPRGRSPKPSTPRHAARQTGGMVEHSKCWAEIREVPSCKQQQLVPSPLVVGHSSLPCIFAASCQSVLSLIMEKARKKQRSSSAHDAPSPGIPILRQHGAEMVASALASFRDGTGTPDQEELKQQLEAYLTSSVAQPAFRGEGEASIVSAVFRF